MNENHKLKLQAAMEECRLHEKVLNEALSEAGDLRFTAESVNHMSTQDRRFLDQMAYRFSKLQDSMGMKILPALTDLVDEPLNESATFAERLQRLERIGVVKSADEWRQLRALRNQISHEYQDAPELKAAALNRFLNGIGSLLSIWKSAERFAERNI